MKPVLSLRWLALVLLSVFSFAVVRAGEKADYFKDAYEKADEKQKEVWQKLSSTPEGLFFSGKYDEALAVLKTKQTPANLALIVDILVETGRSEKAIAFATMALETEKDNTEILAARGDAYMARGEYAKAYADFDKVLGQAGDKPDKGQLRAAVSKALMLKKLGRRAALYEHGNYFYDYFEKFENNDQMSAYDLYAVGLGVIETAEAGDQYQDGFGVLSDAQRKDPTFLPVTVKIAESYTEKYQYGDAESEFNDALMLNPRSVAAHVGLAALDINKRDFEQSEFHAKLALEINPECADAYLVLGLLDFIDEHPADALVQINMALEINPNHVDAVATQAALAWLKGDKDLYKKADEKLHALYASLPVKDDAEREAVKKAADARLCLEISDALSNSHRIEKSLEWARRAVEADPENGAALTQLAITLLRNGLDDEAKPVLEKAFEKDEFNVWIYNLKQLSERDNLYKRHETQRFSVKLYEKEDPLLWTYADGLFDRQIVKCENLFGYHVGKEKIKLSMLKSHADFSARVTGLPQLDASGATFGPFVALVSPLAFKKRGYYINWESVSLHEIAHVVTLKGSNYRIPRWLTEGMSVYTEGWITSQWDVPFATMIAHGMYPDIRTWNRQFHRPQYGWEVPAAYHAAGKFVEWFAEDFGADALRNLVKLYGEGLSTEEVFKKAVSKDCGEMNKWLKDKLIAYGKNLQAPVIENPGEQEELEKKYAGGDKDVTTALRLLRIYKMTNPKKTEEFAREIIAKLNDYKAAGETESFKRCMGEALTIIAQIHMNGEDMANAKERLAFAIDVAPDFAESYYLLAMINKEEGATDKAASLFAKAIEKYPRFVNDMPGGNPYMNLSDIYDSAGKTDDAIKVIESYCNIRRDDPEGYRKLIALYVKVDRVKDAIAAYPKLFAVDPYVAKDHTEYADLLKKDGQEAKAAVELKLVAFCEDGENAAGQGGKVVTNEAIEDAPDAAPDAAGEGGEPKDEGEKIDPRLKDFLDGL
ncbi:MAG: tetratricopeptide repeat protein [Planctomycetes bacterium]|nr:tetratricopeptide repeat protein [Planctomycetota bacterium]